MVNRDFIFVGFTEAAYFSEEVIYFEFAIFKFCRFCGNDFYF